ncbi:Flp pilus assembly protein CpaB [Nocardioides psychrotolerans]|uniref:Flp pilus assembly protein CpaB n=1 Tax=Nocardioides psychrotolerans TaxID=1005945 RepID=UPI0031378AE4
MVAAAVVAALGVALVFLYAQGAENRAQEKFDTVQVLVATQQIESGETVAAALAAGKIIQSEVTSTSVVPGATGDGEVFTNLVALTTIYPGEQLLPAKFGAATDVEATSTLPIPEGQQAITVDLGDPERVAGFVNPGAEVTIYWYGLDPRTGQNVARILHERVLVLGTGSTTQVTTTTTEDPSGAQTVEQLPRTLLTLALNQKEVERTIYADRNGELVFGLLSDSSKVDSDPGVIFENLFR